MMPEIQHLQNSTADSFANHPYLGAIVSLLTALVGTFLPYLLDIQIPILCMQIMQIIVWAIGGAVGILTIIGWIKKHRKK